MATFYVPSEAGWTGSPSSSKLRIKVDQSYNKTSNRSTLTLSLQAYSETYRGNFWLWGNSYLTANGGSIISAGDSSLATDYFVPYAGDTSWHDVLDEGNSRAIKTWTMTVDHDDAGYATVNFTAHILFRMYIGSTQYQTAFYMESSPASLIIYEPRLTTISAGNGTFGRALTITATRKDNSHTHTITTSCLGHSETLCTNSTASTITWTPAVATYAPLLTNAMSTTATIKCQTYSGSTLLGQTTITVTLSLAAADVKPSVSLSIEDTTGAYSRYNAYVATKSKLRITATPTLRYGATQRSVTITANGSTYTESPATTAELVSADSNSVTAKIVDSRGQQSATATQSLTVLAYSAPRIISMSVHRCTSDGTSDDSGGFMRVDYSVSVTPLNNVNAKNMVVQTKKRSASSYTNTTVTLSDYTTSGSVVIPADTESSYDVQLRLQDDYATATILTQLSTAYTKINFGRGAFGGIGLGKVSEAEKTLEFAPTWDLKAGDAEVLSGYFKTANTTISDTGCPAFGFVTDDMTTVNLTIFLQKAIPHNAKVTFSRLRPVARIVTGGYLGAANYNEALALDVVQYLNAGRMWHINGGIMVEFSRSTGWGAPNNTPIVGYCSVTLTYSVDTPAPTPTRYSIENVPSYLRTETQSVASAVNALSSDWQNFVFITDMHGAANQQHSQSIGLYLLDNANVSMLVLGGDYSEHEWSESEYTTYMSPLLESDLSSKIYALYGNHEHWGGFSSGSLQRVYNDFQLSKSGLTGNPPSGYWYIDNADTMTRFMFINTSDQSGSSYVMSDEQINWITQNAVLPTSEWSLVVLGHVNIAQMGGVTTDNEVNGSDIIDAINNCNGTIVSYICGHQHIDLVEEHGGFKHLTLLCDKLENTNYYDGISVTDRESGTASEQAVSVVSINTTTKNVVVRRIGAGRQRTISYAY